MNLLILIGCVFCCVAAIARIVSILVVSLRFKNRDKSVEDRAAGVSILSPICCTENFLEETLRSTFKLDYPRYEIVFCAAGANDPAIPIVQRLITTYPDIEARLLIGNTTVSANQKLNNLTKGWHAARYKWVLMADSNVLMPKDHLQRMLSVWRPDTGLVCPPPIQTMQDMSITQLIENGSVSNVAEFLDANCRYPQPCTWPTFSAITIPPFFRRR